MLNIKKIVCQNDLKSSGKRGFKHIKRHKFFAMVQLCKNKHIFNYIE